MASMSLHYPFSRVSKKAWVINYFFSQAPEYFLILGFEKIKVLIKHVPDDIASSNRVTGE
jgi:hypothetical protein